jgi:hypothetical protein
MQPGMNSNANTALRTIHSTCSPAKFQEALDFLASPGSVQNPRTTFGGEMPPLSPVYAADPSILHRYTTEYANVASCPGKEDANWPLTERNMQQKQSLVINAGEGSTATRFICCLFEQYGFTCGHNVHKMRKHGCSDALDTSLSSDSLGNCTASWDAFDFITDSPVASVFMQLLQSHPESPVLLSVRDPHEWQASRKQSHESQHSEKWPAPGPCGMSLLKLSDPDAWMDFVIYNAWVVCVVPRDQLFVFNVFPDKASTSPVETNDLTAERLLRFLAARQITTGASRGHKMVTNCHVHKTKQNKQ